MPPTVQRVWVDGSGPNLRPYGAAARCKVACTTPGCTTAVAVSGSTDSTWSRWRRVSTTMPGPMALPAIDVPAPRMVTGVPLSRATASTAAISSGCLGLATTRGETR